MFEPDAIQSSVKRFKSCRLSNRAFLSSFVKPRCSISYLQIYKGVTGASFVYKTDRNVVDRPVDFLYFGQRYCFSYNDGFKRELSGELFNYLNAVKIMICFLSINI